MKNIVRGLLLSTGVAAALVVAPPAQASVHTQSTTCTGNVLTPHRGSVKLTQTLTVRYDRNAKGHERIRYAISRTTVSRRVAIKRVYHNGMHSATLYGITTGLAWWKDYSKVWPNGGTTTSTALPENTTAWSAGNRITNRATVAFDGKYVNCTATVVVK